MKIKFFLPVFSVFVFFSFIFSVHAQKFSDVPNTNAYYNAIEALSNQGVIKGYADGTFQPSKAINRVETLKILLLSADIDVKETTFNAGFPDVISGSWYAKYVVSAKEKGIISGNPNGLFYPDNQVNFAEALKMMALTKQVKIPENITTKPFADVPANAWYAPYFQYAKENNIIRKKSDEEVKPAITLTRGEIAELMFRFQEVQKNNQIEKIATYYSDELQGNLTASGEVFDQNKPTAAHKTLEFGTKIKVTNLENNQSVIVTINDRGPHNSDPRYELDLSKSAFQSIAPLSKGLINVDYKIISESEPQTNNTNTVICNYARKFIPKDFYQNILLDQSIPNLYQQNEVFLVSGKVTQAKTKKVTAFLLNNSTGKNESRFEVDVINERFSLPIIFSKTGDLSLGILAGDFGQSYINDITVIAENCQNNFTTTALAPSNLSVSLDKTQTRLTWKNQGNTLSKIEIWQNENKKTYITNNTQENFLIPYKDFINFNKGLVNFRISSAASQSIFSIDRISEWTPSQTQSFTAEKHHQSFNNVEKANITKFPSHYTFGEKIIISGKATTNVDPEAILILPSGLTQTVPLSSSSYSLNTNSQKVIPAGTEFTLTYTPQTTGTYIFEVNTDGGFALINAPVYQNNTYPLIPDLWDIEEHYLTTKPSNLDWDKLKNELLQKINQDRLSYNLKGVYLDQNLSKLALSRAEDMVAKNYFSHQNLEGKFANDLKVQYGIKAPVSENISKDIGINFIHEGLMRSAVHRENILKQKWTRVGIGIALDSEGYLIVVEEFSNEELSQTDFPQLRSQILETLNKKRTVAFLADTILTGIAQTWSDKIINYIDSWFEDPQTSLSLSYFINKQIADKLTASTIFKGDFDGILEKIALNQTLQDQKWKRLGTGISQNEDGILNITLIYSE